MMVRCRPTQTLGAFLDVMPFQRTRGQLQRDSFCLCSPFSSFFLLFQLDGLRQDPPTLVCVELQRTHVQYVFVFLRAPVSCPTSAQIRATVSRGRQKYTALTTHTHTLTLRRYHKSLQEWGRDIFSDSTPHPRGRQMFHLMLKPSMMNWIHLHCHHLEVALS